MSTQNQQKASAAGDRFAVRIGDKPYSPDFQMKAEFQVGWKSVLKANHRSNFAVCLCPGQGEKRLRICRKEASDLFYLSKYPNTGEEHAISCQFYSPAPDKSGLQGYEVGVVEHLSDGDKRVRLQMGLRQTSADKAEGEPASNTPRIGGVSRSSMTLLGLLHLLWTEAALNQWRPRMQGKRSASRVGYWVLEQAKQIRTSRMALSDVMLVHAKAGWREAQRNQTVSTQAKAKGLRLVAVDALARFDPEKHQMPLARLPLSGPIGMPFSYIPQTLWERIEKRFGRELDAWRAGKRVVAIAQIEVKDSGKNGGRVCDLALMVVSDEWIPLDSSHEGAVEQALREEARSFFKPLRYDAGEECVFPDFWLLDVGRDFPLEVFGMNTPEYLARKEEKTAYYDSRYGADGWWYWDAASNPNIVKIPALPKPLGQ